MSKNWLSNLGSWIERWVSSHEAQEHDPTEPDSLFKNNLIQRGSYNQGINNNYGNAVANVKQYVEQLVQIFQVSPQDINFLEDFWGNWSRETDRVEAGGGFV